jgi:hypothetical protein
MFSVTTPPQKKAERQVISSAARPYFYILGIRSFPPSPHEEFGFVGLKFLFMYFVKNFFYPFPPLKRLP